jgi:NAD(P)-dependent dehydrogenase (short-subunit alcohol dehydrogenase family)
MSTIVMTGGTSGFGAVAAERLRQAIGARLILGARRPTSAGESVALDLTRLGSVHAFAASVRDRVGDTPIDALVLNAGVVLPDVAGRTVDGFETTFAVNHLAHYLVLRLLLPALADNAVVVLTTSGTHDPAAGAGLAPPRHADAELLAYPDRDPGRDPSTRKAGQRAYTASKLCTVLTARSLSGHADVRARRIRVVAYCPGQVFGTGLAKDLSFRLRIAWSVLGTPVGWPLRRLNRNLNSRTAAGHHLANLALGVVTPPAGRTYAALRRGRLTWPDPSQLACRDELAQALWNDSARLAGLPDPRLTG